MENKESEFNEMVDNMKKFSPHNKNPNANEEVEFYELILNKDQIQNLMIFLNRTNLSGNEVPAFNELMAILLSEEPPVYKPIEEKLKDVDITLLKNEVDRRETNF